ncbi:ABC transporter ATP-binding protein [Chloroflexota bacterium]
MMRSLDIRIEALFAFCYDVDGTSAVNSSKQHIVEVKGVWKRFGDSYVVRDVSFTLEQAQVLGIVGPNGAGKTTTIRMLLDIIHPDRGEVRVFGQPLTQEAKDRIGYLPEERGLYRDKRVDDILMYLASLKGMDRRNAAERIGDLLEAVGMQSVRNGKVKELSRGMAQLIQFVAAVLHSPRLVILDEPFSGLDPVNVRLVKDLIMALRAQGTAFMLSTHQMNQVEELCDRVVMIDRGEVVLDGGIQEVKRGFGDNTIRVACAEVPPGLPGVRSVEKKADLWNISLTEGTRPGDVLRSMLELDISLDSFEIALPSLEEIFLRIVESRR